MIKQRFGIEPIIRDGDPGKFEIIVDGETIVQRGGNSLTRIFGAGYPDPKLVIEQIGKRVVR
jgi:hypothetical protein